MVECDKLNIWSVQQYFRKNPSRPHIFSVVIFDNEIEVLPHEIFHEVLINIRHLFQINNLNQLHHIITIQNSIETPSYLQLFELLIDVVKEGSCEPDDPAEVDGDETPALVDDGAHPLVSEFPAPT